MMTHHNTDDRQKNHRGEKRGAGSSHHQMAPNHQSIQPIESQRSQAVGPTISWHKINMKVGSKEILNHVSGEVKGGAVCAVMVRSYCYQK